MTGLHTCSHLCDRPACIEAQRRELYAENAQLREAARMALIAEADAVVDKLRALHRATMGYEDACVLRGAELVADALREALGDSDE